MEIGEEAIPENLNLPENSAMKEAIGQYPVMHQIGKYLTNFELQNLRLVDSSWNRMAETEMKLRTYITVGPGRNLMELSEVFRQSQLEFKYRFYGGLWPLKEFQLFFEKGNESVLPEVEIHQVRFTVGDEAISLRGSSSFYNFVFRTINKLTLSEVDFKFPMTAFANVEQLTIIKCNIILKEGRISPVRLHLEKVLFYDGLFRLVEYNINNVINFEKVETLTIICPVKEMQPNFVIRCLSTKLSINLSDCRQLQVLKLTAVSVTQWMRNLTLNTIFLDETKLESSFEVKSRYLSFNGEEIDLSVVSADIEKLEIGIYFHDTTIKSSEEKEFSWLRHLRMYGHSVLDVGLFKACLNLEKMYLGWDWPYEPYDDYVFDVRAIPRSVKTLTLFSIVKFQNVGSIKIDTLILDQYTVKEAEAVVRRIKPKTLIFEWKRDKFEIEKKHNEFFQFVEKFNYQMRICVGPIVFTNETCFKNSPFSSCSRKKRRYYSFENQKGRHISKKDFLKLKQ